MSMPCRISAALSSRLPWERPEHECEECGETFVEWYDSPLDHFPVMDVCPDCHAFQRNEDQPEELFYE